jgi:hypothetical protein
MRLGRTLGMLLTGACTGADPGDKPDTGELTDTGETGEVEVLLPAFVLVVDNSDSMLEETSELAVAAGSALFPDGSLVAITTVDGTGALVGEPITADHGAGVQQQLLCEATCFGDDAALPVDPSYTCGDPFTYVSEEVMACLCPEDWRGNCGPASEQGLESAHQATAALELSDTYEVHVLVISDEGDSSVQLANGDPDVGPYEGLLAGITFHALAPGLDAAGQVICPGTAADWAVQRYQAMTQLTGGMYVDLYDAGCITGDMEAALDAVLAAASR